MMRNAIPLPFLLKHIETSETPIDLLIAQVVPSVLSRKTYWEKRMPNGCYCSRARRCYFYSCFPPLPIQLTQLTQLISVQHTSVPRHTVEDTHANTQTQKHTNTQTHMLRTVIANYDVECILRAKNTPIKPDRNWLMTRGEKQCEGILSMSLLKQCIHLNQVVISLDRLRQLRSKKEKQKPIVRNGRYAGLIRPSIQ